MSDERCLVATIDGYNNGKREATTYITSLLRQIRVVPAAGRAGETVDCERCGATFRFNPGGVYLEKSGKAPCDNPKGAKGSPGSYQLNVSL